MAKRRATSFAGLCLLLLLLELKSKQACHTTFPEGDITDAPITILPPGVIPPEGTTDTPIETTAVLGPGVLGPGTTTAKAVAATTTTPKSCFVQDVPFGTLTPPAGTFTPDGSVVGLVCDASHHPSIIPAAQVCQNGVLSPALQCLVNTCDDYEPLLAPGDGRPFLQSTFAPWRPHPNLTPPVPIGTTVRLVCYGPVGASIVVRFNNPNVAACQNKNNAGGTRDAITLVCDSSGLWQVVNFFYGPGFNRIYTGFVTTPGNLRCAGAWLNPPLCVSRALAPY